MILEISLLAGAVTIGYKNFKYQKEKHTRELLASQLKRSQQLKSKQVSIIRQDDEDLMPQSAFIRTPQDMKVLAVAMGFSSIGYWAYPPLSLVAPPLIIYAARKRFSSAWYKLKRGKIEVETISALSITGAVVSQHFFIGSLLSFTNAYGNYLSSKVIRDSQHKLVDFFKEIPKSVWLLRDGCEISISLEEAKAGDILVVSAGEIIPADGRIIQGIVSIDEHRFTGESVPAEKCEGDEVFAMTLVLSGKMHFTIEKAGCETSAMQIADILNHTADYKSSTVLQAQAVSQQLVMPAFLVSMLTWPVFGFSQAVGVLYAHPKERLQVSAPISLMKYLKQAMDEGILIKDGRSLELLAKVDTIVFDKTGTLTEDQPHIGAIHSFAGYDENDILWYAAIAEHRQIHPLARAIFSEANARNIEISQPERPEHSEYHSGYGVKVTSRNKTILVGSLRFLIMEGITIPDAAKNRQEECRLQGHGLVMVGIDDQLAGAIELFPTIRPEAKAVISALKSLKQIKKTYIISGDHEVPTRQLSQELDIDYYFAERLPQEKAKLIEKLQQEGNFICFIGDGINDAIAMKQAQVSVSLNGASQLATDTAQILLLDQGISHLPRLFRFSGGFSVHMKRQFSIILGSSAFGLSMILLAGWSMTGIMIFNMLGLAATLGYSMIDHPEKITKEPRLSLPSQKNQS